MTLRRPGKDLSFGDFLEGLDDLAIPRIAAPSVTRLWERRVSRRGLLRGSAGLGALALGAGTLTLAGCDEAPSNEIAGRFRFEEVQRRVDARHHVAPGHKAVVLLRWGDPLFEDSPPFDPRRQTPESQLRQFGYNNDFVGLIPLPIGSPVSDRALLCVNHEFTNDDVMFPGLGDKDDFREHLTRNEVDVTMAAHGGSIVEIQRDANGDWHPVVGSRYNRRISPLETEMEITGPAAGTVRLATSADPTARRVIGTLNNCAGGITPWGTYLMAEENFHAYFTGSLYQHPEAKNYFRYGVPGNGYHWGRFHDRFDITKEPNEANRFGWVVEVDPLAPDAMPKKRTALGRFKHEGAETALARDGRAVIYMGDDQRGEYLYKFVSRDPVHPEDPFRNKDVLEFGTLYVAKLDEDGSGTWLPLVYGENGLDASNGFHGPADVMIEARRAADILGATPMDRPEDVQPNPVTGKVYAALTNNSRRKPEEVDGANPRGPNYFGQILEIDPADGDHAATRFGWDLVVMCGPPDNPDAGARWHEATSAHGWFAAPDNLAADPLGRIWVATDQGSGWSKLTGGADGLYGLETEGDLRGRSKCLFRAPVGAEVCGPVFTEDGRSVFLAVQHPAAGGEKDYAPFARNSTFEDPATRWPDFQAGMPPRPSVVVITRKDDGVIG